MPELIAGIEIPDSGTAAEATRLVVEAATPLLFHHSRRVFLFGSLRAARLGLAPHPELLYVAAMFHDLGLVRPFSDAEQRFEIDGADHARRFLLDRGWSAQATDVVWNAIALHTTPGIPIRMGPEIAAVQLGVHVDAVGAGLDDLPPDLVAEIVDAHPRDNFKRAFLQATYDGIKDRPNTTYGTVNADVLTHFEPEFRLPSMVDRVLNSDWAD
ncbi:HD domain-containing protein [Microlunatus sp. Gsoil 973]|uniref:HD domain-containing protein n=1 Tax=Microlunatus sp. Gsoil 973 TaxID=2672569 RepID=UPI0012B48A85|nr:HD domain-containing protein [Microlunatus sp. Gsoil 973]QGN32829.1 HD domain-containing protein [Microlunatus sp. Gsoil 973]